MSYELTWSYVTYTSWLRRPAETFQRCSASDWCCEIHHIIRQWYQLQKSSCIFASGLRNDEQKQCKWELDKIVIGCLTDFFVCFFVFMYSLKHINSIFISISNSIKSKPNTYFCLVTSRVTAALCFSGVPAYAYPRQSGRTRGWTIGITVRCLAKANPWKIGTFGTELRFSGSMYIFICIFARGFG